MGISRGVLQLTFSYREWRSSYREFLMRGGNSNGSEMSEIPE